MRIKRIFKSFLLLLLLAAGLAGVAHIAVYLKVKDSLDDFTESVSYKVDIAYKDLETDLRGRVVLRDVEIFPRGYVDGLQIEQVVFSGPGPLYFFNGGNPIYGDAQPPEKLQMAAHGVRFSLLGDLATVIDEKFKLAAKAQGHGEVDVCSVRGSPDISLLRSMGLKELVFDASTGYEFKSDALDARLFLDFHSIESLTMNVGLKDVTVATIRAGTELPSLSQFRLSIRLYPVFGQRFARFCAGQRRMTPNKFKQKLLEELNDTLAEQGIILGPGLSSAIKDYYQNWGDVEIQASPESPVGVMSLVFLPPNRLQETLNMEVVVNDNLISDLSYSWDPSEVDTTLPALLGLQEELTQTDVPKRRRFKNEFRAVPVAGLKKYLDHNVQIQTKDEYIRSGTLIDVSDQKAVLVQRMPKGKFTTFVKLQDIAKAEAKVRIELPPR